MKLFTRIFLPCLIACLILSGCTSASKSDTPTLKLLTYDSFPTKDTTLNTALKEFTKETGIKVTLRNAGDTGAMVSKAILTSGNPEGDVMWGVDNTFVSRAIDKDIFVPYKAKGLSAISSTFTDLATKNLVTPVDYGDVCVNYDIAYFKEHNLDVPTTLDDLTKPAYKNLLAVEDPASSSPGLAFLLATIAHFGDSGWEQYWKDLRSNGVKVSESWDSAYYELFSGSSGKGAYPLVVSYATSPPAEVIYSDPRVDIAPTGSIAETCFRQVEFAGILRGTKHEKESQQLIDFLISKKFQKEIPLNLFVYPIRDDVTLPQEFTDFSVVPEKPFSIAPEKITKNREGWVDTWTQLVVR